MFRITHGQHAGKTCHTEDEALSMLTPEDLALGGYVHYGSTAFLEGGEYQPPTISGALPTMPSIDGSHIVGLMKQLHKTDNLY
jgi:hypothetical protein